MADDLDDYQFVVSFLADTSEFVNQIKKASFSISDFTNSMGNIKEPKQIAHVASLLGKIAENGQDAAYVSNVLDKGIASLSKNLALVQESKALTKLKKQSEDLIASLGKPIKLGSIESAVKTIQGAAAASTKLEQKGKGSYSYGMYDISGERKKWIATLKEDNKIVVEQAKSRADLLAKIDAKVQSTLASQKTPMPSGISSQRMVTQSSPLQSLHSRAIHDVDKKNIENILKSQELVKLTEEKYKQLKLKAHDAWKARYAAEEEVARLYEMELSPARLRGAMSGLDQGKAIPVKPGKKTGPVGRRTPAKAAAEAELNKALAAEEARIQREADSSGIDEKYHGIYPEDLKEAKKEASERAKAKIEADKKAIADKKARDDKAEETRRSKAETMSKQLEAKKNKEYAAAKKLIQKRAAQGEFKTADLTFGEDSTNPDSPYFKGYSELQAYRELTNSTEFADGSRLTDLETLIAKKEDKQNQAKQKIRDTSNNVTKKDAFKKRIEDHKNKVRAKLDPGHMAHAWNKNYDESGEIESIRQEFSDVITKAQSKELDALANRVTLEAEAEAKKKEADQKKADQNRKKANAEEGKRLKGLKAIVAKKVATGVYAASEDSKDPKAENFAGSGEIADLKKIRDQMTGVRRTELDTLIAKKEEQQNVARAKQQAEIDKALAPLSDKEFAAEAKKALKEHKANVKKSQNPLASDAEKNYFAESNASAIMSVYGEALSDADLNYLDKQIRSKEIAAENQKKKDAADLKKKESDEAKLVKAKKAEIAKKVATGAYKTIDSTDHTDVKRFTGSAEIADLTALKSQVTGVRKTDLETLIAKKEAERTKAVNAVIEALYPAPNQKDFKEAAKAALDAHEKAKKDLKDPAKAGSQKDFFPDESARDLKNTFGEVLNKTQLKQLDADMEGEKFDASYIERERKAEDKKVKQKLSRDTSRVRAGLKSGDLNSDQGLRAFEEIFKEYNVYEKQRVDREKAEREKAIAAADKAGQEIANLPTGPLDPVVPLATKNSLRETIAGLRGKVEKENKAKQQASAKLAEKIGYMEQATVLNPVASNLGGYGSRSTFTNVKPHPMNYAMSVDWKEVADRVPTGPFAPGSFSSKFYNNRDSKGFHDKNALLEDAVKKGIQRPGAAATLMQQNLDAAIQQNALSEQEKAATNKRIAALKAQEENLAKKLVSEMDAATKTAKKPQDALLSKPDWKKYEPKQGAISKLGLPPEIGPAPSPGLAGTSFGGRGIGSTVSLKDRFTEANAKIQENLLRGSISKTDAIAALEKNLNEAMRKGLVSLSETVRIKNSIARLEGSNASVDKTIAETVATQLSRIKQAAKADPKNMTPATQVQALQDIITPKSTSFPGATGYTKEQLGYKLYNRINENIASLQAPPKEKSKFDKEAFDTEVSQIKQRRLRKQIDAEREIQELKWVKEKYSEHLPERQSRRLDERISQLSPTASRQLKGARTSFATQGEGFNSQDAFNFLAFSQLSSAAMSLTKQMVMAAASMEQYRRRIDIVVKNDAKSAKYFDFLVNYEKITPYDINEVMTAGAQFAGQEKSLKRVGLDPSSAIRLAGELGSINPQAGIIEAQRALARVVSGDSNGLEILRSQFGINNENLQEGGVKLSSSGVPLSSLAAKQRVVTAIEKYVQDITGGIGAEGQSTTLQGKLSTLQSQFAKTYDAVMKPLIPTLISGVEAITRLLEAMEALPDQVKTFLGSLALMSSAIISASMVLATAKWGAKALALEGVATAGGSLASAAIGTAGRTAASTGLVAGEVVALQTVTQQAPGIISRLFAPFISVAKYLAASVSLVLKSTLAAAGISAAANLGVNGGKAAGSILATGGAGALIGGFLGSKAADAGGLDAGGSTAATLGGSLLGSLLAGGASKYIAGRTATKAATASAASLAAFEAPTFMTAGMAAASEALTSALMAAVGQLVLFAAAIPAAIGFFTMWWNKHSSVNTEIKQYKQDIQTNSLMRDNFEKRQLATYGESEESFIGRDFEQEFDLAPQNSAKNLKRMDEIIKVREQEIKRLTKLYTEESTIVKENNKVLAQLREKRKQILGWTSIDIEANKERLDRLSFNTQAGRGNKEEEMVQLQNNIGRYEKSQDFFGKRARKEFLNDEDEKRYGELGAEKERLTTLIQEAEKRKAKSTVGVLKEKLQPVINEYDAIKARGELGADSQESDWKIGRETYEAQVLRLKSLKDADKQIWSQESSNRLGALESRGMATDSDRYLAAKVQASYGDRSTREGQAAAGAADNAAQQALHTKYMSNERAKIAVSKLLRSEESSRIKEIRFETQEALKAYTKGTNEQAEKKKALERIINIGKSDMKDIKNKKKEERKIEDLANYEKAAAEVRDAQQGLIDLKAEIAKQNENIPEYVRIRTQAEVDILEAHRKRIRETIDLEQSNIRKVVDMHQRAADSIIKINESIQARKLSVLETDKTILESDLDETNAAGQKKQYEKIDKKQDEINKEKRNAADISIEGIKSAAEAKRVEAKRNMNKTIKEAKLSINVGDPKASDSVIKARKKQLTKSIYIAQNEYEQTAKQIEDEANQEIANKKNEIDNSEKLDANSRKHRDKKKNREIAGQEIQDQIAALEAFKKEAEYRAAYKPEQQSQFQKTQNLQDQFKAEKAILDLKLKAATDKDLNPNISDGDILNKNRSHRLDVLNLQQQYLDKVKAVTSEIEKQNNLERQARMDELQSKLDKQNREKNNGFTMGGTYSLEEMNQRTADESELFRLKAGFGKKYGGGLFRGADYDGKKVMGQDHGGKGSPFEGMFGDITPGRDAITKNSPFNDFFNYASLQKQGLEIKGNELINKNPSAWSANLIAPLTVVIDGKTVHKETQTKKAKPYSPENLRFDGMGKKPGNI